MRSSYWAALPTSLMLLGAAALLAPAATAEGRSLKEVTNELGAVVEAGGRFSSTSSASVDDPAEWSTTLVRSGTTSMLLHNQSESRDLRILVDCTFSLKDLDATEVDLREDAGGGQYRTRYNTPDGKVYEVQALTKSDKVAIECKMVTYYGSKVAENRSSGKQLGIRLSNRASADNVARLLREAIKLADAK